MKKSYKKLSHIFFRKLIMIFNLLREVGTIEELNKINPKLTSIFFDVDFLIDWADLNFKIDKESEDFEDYEEFIDLLKYSCPLCYDCFEDTVNYYMVKNKIWKKYGAGKYQLCIPCLEKRMGRKLKLEDFTNCLANEDCLFVQELKAKK